MTGTMPPISAHTMQVLTGLLEARTGQQLAAYRSWRLDVALKPVMKERGLASLDALVDELLACDDIRLHDAVIDALVNGETSFFRDAPVFDLIGEAVAAAEAEGRRARLWSAACASGQEPLSLAMQFGERTAGLMPEIVATDVSEGALARARSGRFTQFEVQRGLPIRRLMRWFEGRGDDWSVRPRAAPPDPVPPPQPRRRSGASGAVRRGAVPQRAAVSRRRRPRRGCSRRSPARCGPAGCSCSARARR